MATNPLAAGSRGEVELITETETEEQKKNRDDVPHNDREEGAVDESIHPLLADEKNSVSTRIPSALLLVYLSVFIDAFGGLMVRLGLYRTPEINLS